MIRHYINLHFATTTVGKTILEGEAEKYYDNQDPLAAAEFAIDGVVDCLTKVCDCGY